MNQKIRALVVDDNSTDRILIKGILGHLGIYDLHEAEDGQLARFKISNAVQVGKPFHLILLDWHMPSADGIEVLRDIRADCHTKNSIVLIMTATANPRVVREAAEPGVNDFLVKPITLDTLKQKLEHHFKI